MRDAFWGQARLQLFTGARASEISHLQWDWALPLSVLLPDSKTGPKTICLYSLEVQILDGLSRSCDNPFAFPSRRGDCPIEFDPWAAFPSPLCVTRRPCPTAQLCLGCPRLCRYECHVRSNVLAQQNVANGLEIGSRSQVKQCLRLRFGDAKLPILPSGQFPTLLEIGLRDPHPD